MKQFRNLTTLLLTLLIIVANASAFTNNSSDTPKAKHEFPPLPYDYSALEPYIDATTMELHYNKHHRGYYNNFIKAIENTGLESKSIEEIFAQISKHPLTVRNMGGGYYNHILFWENLSPKSGKISTELKTDIEKRFGSWEGFKTAFNSAALTVFGSGWAWLIISDGKLEIVATPNQDNPLMDVIGINGTPLLAIDVWEHAYYLKYQNKRAEYIDAFWNVINWDVVNKRYKQATK